MIQEKGFIQQSQNVLEIYKRGSAANTLIFLDKIIERMSMNHTPHIPAGNGKWGVALPNTFWLSCTSQNIL
jgi:hypothetical protein